MQRSILTAAGAAVAAAVAGGAAFVTNMGLLTPDQEVFGTLGSATVQVTEEPAERPVLAPSSPPGSTATPVEPEVVVRTETIYVDTYDLPASSPADGRGPAGASTADPTPGFGDDDQPMPAPLDVAVQEAPYADDEYGDGEYEDDAYEDDEYEDETHEDEEYEEYEDEEYEHEGSGDDD